MARCSLLALGEIGGLQPPLGVGPPPPGAAARAGGIDEHQIESGAERGDRGGIAGLEHLGIARTRPLEALEDRPQANRIVVVGVDLAGVAHGGGEGQRLAAGACTNIEHLLARPGGGHQRGDLRALVLHLVPAPPMPDLGLDVGLPSRSVRRRQPDTDRRQRRRLGGEARQRFQHLVAVGLEGVHAQVDRGSAGQRRALLGRSRAEGARQGRLQPVREIAAHRHAAHRPAPRAPVLPARPRSAAPPHAPTRRRWRSRRPATAPAHAGRPPRRSPGWYRRPSARPATGGGAARRRRGCRWSPDPPSRRSDGSCPSRPAPSPPDDAASARPRAPRWRP